ncbi:MAG: hypothetical protein M1814_001525 [Vezdaea aestivalis]|nr:MAG: hypothetical protein M1814_001525 [Vezdaea aestivalis]
MAPLNSRSHENILNAVVEELSDTRAQDIPLRIPSLVKKLHQCQGLIEHSGSASATSAISRLNTLITAKLSSRAPEKRWAGIVLVKTVIEWSNWDILSGAGQWTRIILQILKKPDSVQTKTLGIVTLTRIFIVLAKFPTLVRELVTPNLPAYLTTCLNLISKVSNNSSTNRSLKDDRSLLQYVFESFNILLPRYATIFRPFLSQLEYLLRSCIVHQDYIINTPTLNAARKLFAGLHFCAPKNTNAEYWTLSLRSLVKQTHTTSTYVFRSIIEDWRPPDGLVLPVLNSFDFAQVISEPIKGPLGVAVWTEMHCGIARLIDCLHIMESFFIVETAIPVAIPVGAIMDLLCRQWSVLLPTSNVVDMYNKEIGLDERSKLFSGLPEIHVAGLRALGAMVRSELRASVYLLLTTLLPLCGLSLPKHCLRGMSNILRRCADDCLSTDNFPQATIPAPQSNENSKHKSTSNPDAFTSDKEASISKSIDSKVHSAAKALLPILLYHLDVSLMHPTVRNALDRAAVLTNNKRAMLGSVLNHAPGTADTDPPASILTHLVRAYGGAIEIDPLVRPRLPVIAVSGKGTGGVLSDELDDLTDERFAYAPEDLANFPAPLFSMEGKEEDDDVLMDDGLESSIKPAASFGKRPDVGEVEQMEGIDDESAKQPKEERRKVAVQPSTLPGNTFLDEYRAAILPEEVVDNDDDEEDEPESFEVEMGPALTRLMAKYEGEESSDDSSESNYDLEAEVKDHDVEDAADYVR